MCPPSAAGFAAGRPSWGSPTSFALQLSPSVQCGCPGQPGLLVGNPAHGRGLKLDEHCAPLQPRPFYHPITLWLPPDTQTYNADLYLAGKRRAS